MKTTKIIKIIMEKENEIIESPKVSKLTEASKESLLVISKWGKFYGNFLYCKWCTWYSG